MRSISPLLTEADPLPLLRSKREGAWLLTVEHAGRAIPRRLGDLGLPEGEIDRHIGWDPGASDLASRLHDALGGTLLQQPYSRLVIDCNRPRTAPDLIPETSDRTLVPANVGLGDDARQERWDAIHRPFHAAVAEAVAARPRALVSIHSYDPQRHVDAASRPWPVGLLGRDCNALARHLAAALDCEPLASPLGINQPYCIEDGSDYTIPVHAEPAGLPHILIEVRNDHLRSEAAVAAMARLLAAALSSWSD